MAEQVGAAQGASGAKVQSIDPDAQVLLARKLSSRDAGIVLTLVVLVPGLVAVAATQAPWVAFLMLPLPGLLFVAGRKGATRPLTRNGPLWHLSAPRCRQAVDDLTATAGAVAAALQVPADSVRANVWAPDDTGHMLHMVVTLSLRMSAAEQQIRIPEGFGCSGVAFRTRATSIAPNLRVGGVIRADDGVELVNRYYVGDQESRLHPDLAWVVAAPIWAADDAAVVGVVSVDGLVEQGDALPAAEALQGIAHHVVTCAATLTAVLVEDGLG